MDGFCDDCLDLTGRELFDNSVGSSVGLNVGSTVGSSVTSDGHGLVVGE